jgi:hypothetical protein
VMFQARGAAGPGTGGEAAAGERPGMAPGQITTGGGWLKAAIRRKMRCEASW